ncbi:hypothetical protein [Delftia phage PhiW-14]|uniref:Uncharacterized protein n=1 Tax=Delftia phage PhiW-14 TaxID=665032 RepID=C9DGG7_BPW14|nr:hypothetical protein DP-phiW-14_gp197 [Delftia phage PhiW-14]ACV50218.1 hypothetical protein [Delftia phage PhiW-14]
MKIKDVIMTYNDYSDKPQVMVLVEGNKDKAYVRCKSLSKGRGNQGDLLVGSDPDRLVFNFYRHEGASDSFKAFGGRTIAIPMVDGSTITGTGEWWDAYPSEEEKQSYDVPDTVQVGWATLEDLKECHVYYAGHIRRAALVAWLANNTPSHDYNKYNPRHQLGYHIKSIDEGGFCMGVKITSQRARALKKVKGRIVYKHTDGQWYNFRILERWLRDSARQAERASKPRVRK